MYLLRTHLKSVFVITALFLLGTQVAFADTPAVTSFTANPTSIHNNYTAVFSWNISNGTGHTLYIDCPLGVTVKTETGSSFPCKTRQSTSGGSFAAFAFANVSGTAKNITATIYPKDSAGADYDAGSMSTSISVGTSVQPITDFSVSSTTVPSNGSVTLTWRGVDTPSTNIIFDCASDVRLFATSPSISAALPCGTPAFSSDLPTSGSVVITPVNESSGTITITARMVPSIASGLYDATHALSGVFSVAPKPPHANPSVSSFSSSATTIVPGVPFTFSWVAQNAAHANLQFSCNDSSLTIQSVSGTSTVLLPCNAPAFNPALSVTGSTTIVILNQDSSGKNVLVSLLPQDSAGAYFATTGRTLALSVLPHGSAPFVQGPQISSPPAIGTVTALVPKAKHYSFTRALQRGSQNADVTALQTFLAQTPSIYPEGMVTGYFGPATEKALRRFQEKYGIAAKGVAGYGTVGPKTRAKLNAGQ